MPVEVIVMIVGIYLFAGIGGGVTTELILRGWTKVGVAVMVSVLLSSSAALVAMLVVADYSPIGSWRIDCRNGQAPWEFARDVPDFNALSEGAIQRELVKCENAIKNPNGFVGYRMARQTFYPLDRAEVNYDIK